MTSARSRNFWKTEPLDDKVPIKAYAYDSRRGRLFAIPDLRPREASHPRLREEP